MQICFERHCFSRAGALLALLVFACIESEAAEAPQRPRLRTFFTTRSLNHDRLIPYLETARPQLVQIVNYNREESAPESTRTDPGAERPNTVKNKAVELRMRGGHDATAATLHFPDTSEAAYVEFEQRDGRVLFSTPRLHVYAVVAIETRHRKR